MKLCTTVALVLLVASPALAADNPSRTFLKKAIEGNYAEIQMGKLAQQNGKNDSVKQLGLMLSDDHAAANRKAIDAARAMDLPPPDGPNAKQKADYDRMAKLTGERFDRDFAKHMVMDHDEDLADYKKEAKQADAAGDYAKGEIDVLQKHFDSAKSLRSIKSSSR